MFALSTWSQSVPWQFQMHIPCSREWYKRAIPASCCEVIKKRCQHSITERQLDDSEHSALPINDTIANDELSLSVVDFKLPGSATLNPSMGTGDQGHSEESDETDSLISADSTSPLVDVCD